MNNTIKTTLLLSGLTCLFLVFGKTIGGNNGMMLAFFFACVMNFSAYWFSDQIVLKMYRAQPVAEKDAPEIFNMVREMAQKDNLPMPRLYVIPSATPNAFATGRDPEHAVVAVTQGIVDVLNEEELRGVLGHELAHVAHRDILICSIAATLAGAIGMLASMLRWAFIFGGGRSSHREGSNPFAMLAMSILMPIAAVLIQCAISRSREFLADRKGAQLCGNPHYLASALQKLEVASKKVPMREANPATAHMFIVNPLTGRGLASLFSTHPPTEERIARLTRLSAGET